MDRAAESVPGKPINSLAAGKRRLRRYCRWTAGLAAGALTAIVTLNLLVDPYGIHRGPWSAYWRPSEKQHTSRIAKAELAVRDVIDVAILGDSRAVWGIGTPPFPMLEHSRVYNLGLVGASVHESSRSLDLLLSNAKRPPGAVIWLMQPEFVVRDRRPRENFDYRQSRLNPQYDEWQGWLNSVWGSDTTYHSLMLLKGDSRAKPSFYARGFSQQKVSAQPITREYFYQFREQQRVYLTQHQGASDAPELEELLHRQLTECARRGVMVHVVIPPSHALYWQLMEAEGWGERIETGKRCLVRVAAAANDAAGGKPLIHVWDFSGFTGLAAEPPPSPSEPKAMVYHQDAVHFTKTLGDLLIQRLSGPIEAYPEFGIELTERNLESHLANWESACRDYGASELRLAAETDRQVR